MLAAWTDKIYFIFSRSFPANKIRIKLFIVEGNFLYYAKLSPRSNFFVIISLAIFPIGFFYGTISLIKIPRILKINAGWNGPVNIRDGRT